MTKQLTKLLSLAMLALIFAACANENVEPQEDGISHAVLLQFTELGFDVSDLRMEDGNYIVEGDIIISPERLERLVHPVAHDLASGEQYHTFELVDVPAGGRTIVINGSAATSTFSTALNNAIDIYNAENLALTFVRNDNANNADIVVNIPGGGAGGSAGFPDNGDPYGIVNVTKATKRFGVNVLTHVFVHEIGHCIGFRHTDWFNRSISCGQGGSEGQSTTGVGAVHIPGTPTTNVNSNTSVMNSCFNSGSNGQWTSSDQTALDFLYGN